MSRGTKGKGRPWATPLSLFLSLSRMTGEAFSRARINPRQLRGGGALGAAGRVQHGFDASSRKFVHGGLWGGGG